MKTIILFLITGLGAGFINGLFGTGGALPLLALFAFLALKSEKVFATTSFAVLLLSAVSLILYLKNGTISPASLKDHLGDMIIPAALGGAVGSLLLAKIAPGLLKKIFFAIVVIGGVGMVFR